MDYRTLGNSGTVVSTLCLGTMTFGAETDEDGALAQLDRFVEAGRHLHRHRRRLLRRRLRGDHRALAAQPAGRARPPGDRHQGPVPDGRRAQRRRPVPGHLTRALDASLRRLGVEDRRPLPGARLGPADPARGDAAVLRRRGPRRQDPLRGGQQLHRLAVAEGRPAHPAPRPGPDRDPAAAVQPAGPGDRVRVRAGLRERGHRHPALVAAGRRLADRQVPARRARPPARPGSARTRSAASRPTRVATPRSAPGGCSTRSARSPRTAGCRWPRWRWPGWPTGPAVTSVILGARTTEQLDDNLAAADLVLDAEETAAGRGERPSSATTRTAARGGPARPPALKGASSNADCARDPPYR